jgi:hypothetical protein
MMVERKADQERMEAERKAYEEMMAERKDDQERREAERKAYVEMMAERKGDQERREAEKCLRGDDGRAENRPRKKGG